MKKWIALFLCAVLCLALGACASEDPGPSDPADPLDGVPVTEAYDGYWSDGAGTVLYLDSAGRYYYLQTPAGRLGRGEYLPKEADPTLYFDGDLYSLIPSGEAFSLKRTGTAAGAESLDGTVFFRDDWAEMNDYVLSDLDGTWENDAGAQLSVFTDQGQYEMVSGVSGSVADDGNGKGYYLKSGDLKIYVSMSAERDAIILQGGESVSLSGVFLRKMPVPGVNDAETLAQYAHFYDTWYQHQSTSRASVVLNGDGTWESYDKNRVKTGEGKLYATAEGTLALYDFARRFCGTVSIDAKDQLYYTAESDAHDDHHPYFRAAVSY